MVWEIIDYPEMGPIFRGRLEKWNKSPDEVKVSEQSGQKRLAEFLDLPKHDLAKLADFLNKVGVWSSDDAQTWGPDPLYAYPESIWLFQEGLEDARHATYQKNFLSQVTPTLPKPKTLLDLMAQRPPANNFPFSFELTEVAAGVITIVNARHMLLATVLADIAKGIRFKVCKRKDCGKSFPLESEHKRKFCSQYCGHLFSLRRARKKAKKKAVP